MKGLILSLLIICALGSGLSDVKITHQVEFSITIDD